MFILAYIHIHTMCFPCKGKYKRTFSACIHTTLNETRPVYTLSSHRGNISLHKKPVFKCMLHDGQRRGLLRREKVKHHYQVWAGFSTGEWTFSSFFFFFFSGTQKSCKRWLEYKMRIYDKREDNVLIRLKNLKITFFPPFSQGTKHKKGGGWVGFSHNSLTWTMCRMCVYAST